jgi:hypothetical protein
MPDVRLELVPWSPGTQVGAYPRRSEQMLPGGPPTGVAPVQTQPVADDASLSFSDLAFDAEFWAAAPVNNGPAWRYVSFNTPEDERDVPGLPGPEGPQGPQGASGPTGP